MRLEFGVLEYLRRALPQHKRQPNRLALFTWPLSEIEALWLQFREWRKEMIYEANVTGQTLSLVDLLNRRVTGAQGGISIIESTDSGIFISVLSEGTDYALLSKVSENTAHESISRKGEGGAALAVDFKVIVPVGVNAEEVRNIVDRYCIAGYNYEVTNTLQ